MPNRELAAAGTMWGYGKDVGLRKGCSETFTLIWCRLLASCMLCAPPGRWGSSPGPSLLPSSLFLEGTAGGSSLTGKDNGFFLKMVTELEVLTAPILLFMLGAWINPDVNLPGSCK